MTQGESGNRLPVVVHPEICLKSHFYSSRRWTGSTLRNHKSTKGEPVSHHMVIFENREGHPGYNQFDSVEAAVTFVEDLRNNQGIEKFQIFELNEVKFEMKQYFRVELKALTAGNHPDPDPATARMADAGAPQPSAASPTAPPPSAPPAADAAKAPSARPAPPAPPAASPAPSGAASAPANAAGRQSAAQPSAPVPPADQPKEQSEQPARRGLFGR